MYTDKAKQKEANRLAAQRQRDKKGMTAVGMTQVGMTQVGMTRQDITGSIDINTLAMVDAACGDKLSHGLPINFGQPDCDCRHCQQNRRSDHKLIINHGAWKPAGLLAANEVNRVSLPGDVDYDGYMVKGDDGIWRQKQTQKPEPQIDLPACVPDSVGNRYSRAEPSYVRTINRLLSNSLSDLEAEGVWIPSWRHNAGENLVQAA